MRTTHPKVKPIDLMTQLVELVTPPDGLVLDPFCGPGATGIATTLEHRRFVVRHADDRTDDAGVKTVGTRTATVLP
jgi:hypothetical protein